MNDGLRFSDWASGKLFSRHRLAQTFPDSDVVPFERFPYNFYDVVDPGVDLENWTLTVEGLVQRPGEYTAVADSGAAQSRAEHAARLCRRLGRYRQFRRRARLRFSAPIGADTSARFLEVDCVDGYYESIDMATVLHPQTLFCYEMYGKPLDRGHGAPLRLQMPTKLGYKQAKYLEPVRVSNVLRGGMRGYWEDQGYSWYGGL